MNNYVLKSTLSSRKFWFALIGSTVATIAYKITDDSTFALSVLGAFSLGIGGNILDDSINKNNQNK